MNRNIRESARVLGVRESDLRTHLQDTKVLNDDGTLAARYIGRGHLFMDPRQRWNDRLNKYVHYSVLMVTEAGIDWLAGRLGVSITTTSHKDDAA